MLTFNYRYRIYPDAIQEATILSWMDICRGAYNYGLREIKDWCDSRKCLVDRCSLEKKYILPAETRFPNEINQLNNLPKAKKEWTNLSLVPSQVLQQVIKQLHKAWEYFQKRGFGFPRFKKYGQLKSIVFPQFKSNPVTNLHLLLPKVGAIPINLHRPIPNGFTVKQVRILRKADRWYASINIQGDVSIPDPLPYGHPIGVDIGLEKFLATSDGQKVKPPKFFKQLQMLDCGFGQFRTIVKYVCWKRGKFFAEVDARGTSQECPECGGVVKKDLSIRTHCCPHCGYTTDRDVAAGQNIRNRGIKLISTPGLGGTETACADELPGIGKTQSRQVSKSRKGITRKSKKRFLEAPTIATQGA
jgi:transposase